MATNSKKRGKSSKSEKIAPPKGADWEADENNNNIKVILEDVRFSFSGNGRFLFEPEEFKKNLTYKQTYIIEDDDQIDKVTEIIDYLKEAHLDGKDPEHCCFRDGDDHISEKTGEVYDGFAGNWYVAGKRSDKQGPPEVFNAHGDQIEEYPDKGIFRDGCRGNVMGRFYFSEEWGNIGFTIEAVVFTDEGEPFAAETSVAKSPELKKKLFGGFKPKEKKSDKVFGKGRRKLDEEPDEDDDSDDEEEEDDKPKRRKFGRR